MSWNYRVIRTEDAGGVCYAIHECHYANRADIVPNSWTKEPTVVLAETHEGLLTVLDKMREAATGRVLEIAENGTKLREYHHDRQ
jgi:hypothetical protein